MKTRSRNIVAYGGIAPLKMALLASAVLATSPVAAQETATSVGADEEELVVTARRYVPEGSLTATKTDAPLIETPQSISVITRDQIDLLNFIDVQQSIRYTAGIVGENYGPDLRYDFLTLRGFTPVQYIDGLQAPIGATITNVGVDIYGFETVDILKGPASVLYGTTPPGGIYNLNLQSHQPASGERAGRRAGSEIRHRRL
jgi:iron complex outermembrane recepter protein